jgi:adenylate cyclase
MACWWFMARSSAQKRLLKRLVAIPAIAIISAFLAMILVRAAGSKDVFSTVDNSFYDAAYRLRTPVKLDDSEVVVLAIDQRSLEQVAQATNFSWPWPRGYWGFVAQKLESMGAKVVALDLLLSERSAYDADDDQEMAEALDKLKSTRFVGAVMGETGRFVPPVNNSVPLGDAGINVDQERTYRRYMPVTRRGDSLALLAIRSAGRTSAIDVNQPFRLHYYGPHRTADGEAPFPVYSIGPLITEIAFDRSPNPLPPEKRFDPERVRGKIVFIGPLAPALSDIKRTPVSDAYPGVEIHATAALNMIRNQQVTPVAAAWVTTLSFLGALVVSGGIVLNRAAWLKLGYVSVVVVGLVAISAVLMQRDTIRWLPPVEPLLGALLASVGALVWVFRIEDARARALLRVLSQCISPDVARDLDRDPTPLTTGGQRRELSILFTDLNGFTSMTERLREGIEPVLNLYLAEMSAQVLLRNGTIDKYIGDAMMLFWNAPLPQPDHAILACETALALVAHEKRIAPDLAKLGADKIFTRIGIHTGPAVVGFFGSKDRLTYTAVGDSVNLAARLEPINKEYGTQVLVSQDTVSACSEKFLFRPVGRLRVYGRSEPAGVYELMSRMGDATDDQRWLAEASTQAAGAYLDKRFEDCLVILDEVLTRFPDDAPSRLWQGRVADCIKNAPEGIWDGVWEQKSK